MTTMVAVPLLPSLVAVIVAKPAPTPATRPELLTIATAVSLLAQVTVPPKIGWPPTSCGVAVSCTVAAAWIVADAGLMATGAASVATVGPAGGSQARSPISPRIFMQRMYLKWLLTLADGKELCR